MSLLTILWVISFLTIVVTILFAYYRARFVALSHAPHDLGEFIHDALTHLAGGVGNVAESAKPHAERMAFFLATVGKKGHDKFINRVFGKTTQERGKTASFFLKYIAENQEEKKGTDEQKAGLQK